MRSQHRKENKSGSERTPPLSTLKIMKREDRSFIPLTLWLKLRKRNLIRVKEAPSPRQPTGTASSLPRERSHYQNQFEQLVEGERNEESK